MNGVSYERVTSDILPGWSERDRRAAQSFGAGWASEMRSAVLVVPSYVARIERNIVINPHHAEPQGITHELPEPVWWDERLFS